MLCIHDVYKRNLSHYQCYGPRSHAFLTVNGTSNRPEDDIVQGNPPEASI